MEMDGCNYLAEVCGRNSPNDLPWWAVSCYSAFCYRATLLKLILKKLTVAQITIP